MLHTVEVTLQNLKEEDQKKYILMALEQIKTG
jgi:hypothetical protein